jgi:hypothetical protein
MCTVYLQLKQWIFGLCVVEMKDKYCWLDYIFIYYKYISAIYKE